MVSLDQLGISSQNGGRFAGTRFHSQRNEVSFAFHTKRWTVLHHFAACLAGVASHELRCKRELFWSDNNHQESLAATAQLCSFWNSQEAIIARYLKSIEITCGCPTCGFLFGLYLLPPSSLQDHFCFLCFFSHHISSSLIVA